MSKKQVLATVIATLSIGAAGAATLTITDNNNRISSGTLGGVTVDPNGNTTITASGMTYPASSGTAVTPAAGTVQLTGSVTGLPTGDTVVLKNNGADTAMVTEPGTTFNFPSGLTYSSGYAVTVGTQPTGGSCTVANGSGVVGGTLAAPVISQSVAVTCSTTPVATPGVCGTLASNTVLDNAGVNGKFYNLQTGIYSFAFTPKAGYNNMIASYSSKNPVQKIVWFSACPGAVDTNGTPVLLASRFIAQGYTNAGLLYNGVSSTTPNMASAQLTIGKTYYFNVRNATTAAPAVSTCPTGQTCPFVLSIPN